MDREKVIDGLIMLKRFIPSTMWEPINDALALLKEQDELLKHEYWRGYNNGRADERGLQEGTIMQTFSPD